MLDEHARRLAEYMSELSEAAYYAGWMQDLEFALWEIVVSGPADYGHAQITSDMITRLKELAHACDGWIFFDPETEENFVPMSEWHQRFAEWSNRAH